MSDTPKTDALFDATVRDHARELERECVRLQMELDASCNAEELRQARAERDRYKAALQTLLTVEESWCGLNDFCSRGDLNAAMAKARAALNPAENPATLAG